MSGFPLASLSTTTKRVTSKKDHPSEEGTEGQNQTKPPTRWSGKERGRKALSKFFGVSETRVAIATSGLLFHFCLGGGPDARTGSILAMEGNPLGHCWFVKALHGINGE